MQTESLLGTALLHAWCAYTQRMVNIWVVVHASTSKIGGEQKVRLKLERPASLLLLFEQGGLHIGVAVGCSPCFDAHSVQHTLPIKPANQMASQCVRARLTMDGSKEHCFAVDL